MLHIIAQSVYLTQARLVKATLGKIIIKSLNRG